MPDTRDFRQEIKDKTKSQVKDLVGTAHPLARAGVITQGRRKAKGSGLK
jgi:hypothetical protein